MTEPKYNLSLNGKYFDTLYGVDYYNDKKPFFLQGEKQFFILYQIMRHRDSVLTIEDKLTGYTHNVNDEEAFKQWVNEKYIMYFHSLEKF